MQKDRQTDRHSKKNTERQINRDKRQVSSKKKGKKQMAGKWKN